MDAGESTLYTVTQLYIDFDEESISACTMMLGYLFLPSTSSQLPQQSHGGGGRAGEGRDLRDFIKTTTSN